VTAVTESLVDAKDEARQAEVRAEIAVSVSTAVLTILDGQRASDRAAFRLGMWMIGSVFAAAAAVVGIMIALQP
jgi:hypothetical protein